MSRAYEAIIASLSSFDPDERRLAVEASVKFGDKEEIVDKLLMLLNDEDKGVRDAAADAIILIAGQFENLKMKIIKNVCESLCCGDVRLRNLSAELLSKIGKDSLGEIIQLANYSDKDVRKMAVDLIGLIGDSSVVEFLIEKLNDPDPNVIASAVEALGRIGDERAVDALINLFAKFEFVQILVVEALGKIGERLGNREIISDFLSRIFEEVDDVVLKSAVIEALGKVGNENNIEFLMNLTFDESLAVQKMAIISIVEMCARRNCNLQLNEYFFKSFFEKAKKIFSEINDVDFKVYFLDFISKFVKYDEVKSFILSLLNQRGEILAKVYRVVSSNAVDLIKLALRDEIGEKEFVNLVEVVFYNTGKTFEDQELKGVVIEKLLGIFDRVEPEVKISILNLLHLLDKTAFEEIRKRTEDESDPLVKMYIDSNLKHS